MYQVRTSGWLFAILSQVFPFFYRYQQANAEIVSSGHDDLVRNRLVFTVRHNYRASFTANQGAKLLQLK
jgi:hypothetical protein